MQKMALNYEAFETNLRISNQAGGPGIDVLVLDKSGDCAVIEFLDGRMQVHRGRDLPVKVLDVNADMSGDVTNRFSDYTYSANRDLIGRSFSKTGFLSEIPDERLDAIARLPDRFECR